MKKRDTVIKVLHHIGDQLAEIFDYSNIQTLEDRQKGVWGENMTKYLERTYGECTEECKWFKDDVKNSNIEFRYRFSTPCLSIRFPNDVFAEIEISDFDNDTKEHTDNDWHIGQVTCFNYDKSKKYLDLLVSKWKDYESFINNEYSEECLNTSLLIKEGRKHGSAV